MGYSALVGTKVAPGLLQAVLLTRRLGRLSWARFMAVQRGKLAGLMTVLRTRQQAGAEMTGSQSLARRASAS